MEEMTLQELIQESLRLRTEASEFSKAEAQARAEKDVIDVEIIARLEAMGVDSTRTDTATVSIQKTKVANVDDWEAFSQFVLENDAVYLLQRRVAAKALDEMAQLQEEGVIPGVSFFEKTSLALRQR